jgi:hypothetical protein
MSEPVEPNDDHESDAVRDLVKRALATDALAKDAPDILRGVQRRIRLRSRGKFFADGWSNTQARQAYLLLALALATLIVVGLAYYALLPPMDIR